MKKLILGLLILSIALIGSVAHAGQNVWKIIDVTLDDDPTEAVSANMDIRHYRKVGFFVVYDETEVGGGVSALINITLNPTATVGSPASGYFYDFGGGTTLQTSESISADGEYYFWLPEDAPFPYVQVTVTGTATDTDDTIALIVYLIAED